MLWFRRSLHSAALETSSVTHLVNPLTPCLRAALTSVANQWVSLICCANTRSPGGTRR